MSLQLTKQDFQARIAKINEVAKIHQTERESYDHKTKDFRCTSLMLFVIFIITLLTFLIYLDVFFIPCLILLILALVTSKAWKCSSTILITSMW